MRGGSACDNSTWVSDPRIPQLEHQLAGLAAENQQLRGQLEQIQRQRAAVSQATAKVARGGARFLVPLFDRNKVVRSFGKLAETIGNFTGPREGWPSREDVLGDAHTFMESCVRFTVRRRTLFWVFSLLAASIPVLQLWVVIQQNAIISNQNEFFEIQVHDVVSRSMTEGDRNARLMTGALLSRANLAFLSDVVDEAFDPELAGISSTQGVDASQRRLEDAAFRGFLMRAVARGVELRADDDADELASIAQPMLRKIVLDAADRVPQLLRFGEGTGPLDGELREQASNFLHQLGAVIRVYGRLARSTGATQSFGDDLRPLLVRVSKMKLAGNRFAQAYGFALEQVAFEAAVERELDDGPVDWDSAERDPDATRTLGVEKLREMLGGEEIAWDAFERQLSG